MDYQELMQKNAKLESDSRILTALVDTILDSSRLSRFDEKTLTIEGETPIFAIVKAFFRDEYINRVEELEALRTYEEG